MYVDMYEYVWIIRLVAAPNVCGLSVAATLKRTLMVAITFVYTFRHCATTKLLPQISTSESFAQSVDQLICRMLHALRAATHSKNETTAKYISIYKYVYMFIF